MPEAEKSDCFPDCTVYAAKKKSFRKQICSPFKLKWICFAFCLCRCLSRVFCQVFFPVRSPPWPRIIAQHAYVVMSSYMLAEVVGTQVLGHLIWREFHTSYWLSSKVSNVKYCCHWPKFKSGSLLQPWCMLRERWEGSKHAFNMVLIIIGGGGSIITLIIKWMFFRK